MKRFSVVSFCLLAGLLLVYCQPADPAPDRKSRRAEPRATQSEESQQNIAIASRLLVPREKGPPLQEDQQAVLAARTEAERLAWSLQAGGISRREVASIADMRGYRHFRQRHFAQAHAWFQRAAQTDATFELSQFNVARSAALLGRRAEAISAVRRLQTLKTPLARALLLQVEKDPDLATVAPLFQPSR